MQLLEDDDVIIFKKLHFQKVAFSLDTFGCPRPRRKKNKVKKKKIRHVDRAKFFFTLSRVSNSALSLLQVFKWLSTGEQNAGCNTVMD